VKVYGQSWLESTQGMRAVWPNNPIPSDWYDKTKHDSWAPYSVTVTESTTAPPPGPPSPIFRMKLSDESVRTLLQLPSTGAPPAGALATKALSMATAAKPASFAASALPAGGAVRMAAMAAPIALPARNLAAADTASSAVLHAQLVQEYAGLSMKNKVAVGQFVASAAPTQPATTKSVSLAFEYCKVDIKRPWYIDAFISDKSWFVPTVAKGELNSENPGMSLLPIALVAVQNLAINASWTAQDVANAKVSDGFGPFKVTFDSQSMSLTHIGVQIVGWVVEKLPQLPPNDPQ